MGSNEHDPLDRERCLALLCVPINALLILHTACPSLGVVYDPGHWVNIRSSEPNFAGSIHRLLQMNVLGIDGCLHHDCVITGKVRVVVNDETKRGIDMSIGAIWTHRTILCLSITPLLHSWNPINRGKYRQWRWRILDKVRG